MEKKTEPIFRVKLLKEMPLFYGGVPTWYESGHLFDVLQVKQLPAIKDPCYELRSVRFGVTIQGWVVSDNFEKVEE